MSMIKGMRRSSSAMRRLVIDGDIYNLLLRGKKADVEKRKKEIQEENASLRKAGRKKDVKKYRMREEGTQYSLYVRF